MRYRVYLVHAEVEVFIRQMCNLDLRYATGAFAGTRGAAVGGCKIGVVRLGAMIGPRIVLMNQKRVKAVGQTCMSRITRVIQFPRAREIAIIERPNLVTLFTSR